MRQRRHPKLLAGFLLGLSGCQLVFPLTNPAPAPVDGALDDDDDDGFANDLDNCPDASNPDQSDRDDDGIGDACDGCDHCLACDVAPLHDEDGDHVVDGCDNCPASANELQDNVDGDDLGDACDPDASTQQHRRLFWGFSTLENWLPPADWQIIGDAAAPDPARTDVVRLTRFGIGIQAETPWSFEVGLELPPPAPDGRIVGVRPVAETALGSLSSCSLIAIGGVWKLSGGGPQVDTSTEAPVVLRLSSNGALGIDTSICTIVGGATTTSFPSAPAYPVFPQFFMNPGAAVRYIDVIQ